MSLNHIKSERGFGPHCLVYYILSFLILTGLIITAVLGTTGFIMGKTRGEDPAGNQFVNNLIKFSKNPIALISVFIMGVLLLINTIGFIGEGLDALKKRSKKST